jgi:general secretion pathway protein K
VAPPRQEKRQGFALLLVIWVLALLAVIAAGIAADSRSESVIARNRVELARARDRAEAGIAIAITGLTVPDMTLRWVADGSTRTIAYDGGSVAITVQDEGGKIDLNQAPLELIASLFDTLAPETRESREAVMNAIAQQRQAATERARLANPRGVDFPRRRRTASLADAAFADIAELQQVAGMSRAVFDQIRPFVTVYSQSPTINPLTAPREVLAALPGVDGPAIDLYMMARQAQQIGQPTTELPSLGAAASRYISMADLRAVTITTKAATTTGPSFSREALVSFDGTTTLPFRFLAWRQGAEPSNLALTQAGQ